MTSAQEQARLATLTPVEFVKELNAESCAWAQANPGAWAGELTEDPSHWERYKTGLDTAFGLARSTYSDLYKETYGVRPRGRSFVDLNQVESAIDELLALE